MNADRTAPLVSPLLRGARRIVAISAGVRPGESVVILTDRDRPPAVAAALAQVVDEIGATPIVLTMPALPSGAEPPQPVTAAMARADVILAPTSGAIYHTESVRDATTQGARFLALTAFTEDVLMRGGVFADFPTVGHRAEEAAALITAALDAAADEHAYTLAELAFGLNPDGIIRGVIVEDEGVAGTGHVALGSNRFFGGTSAAPIHLDFVFHRPSLWLDGHSLMEHGRFVEGSGI